MRRTKEEAAVTRATLLKTALSVFSAKGYAASTLDDVAKAAKVTRGASGLIRKEGFGTVSGIQVRYRCTIPATILGASGNCLVTALKPTLFMWTIRIGSG